MTDTASCVLDVGDHPRPATTGRLCTPHATRLGQLLDPDETGQLFASPGEDRRRPSIPVLHELLDAAPTVGEPLGGGVFRSSPPGDLRVMAHRDPRLRTTTGPDDDPDPPMPVLGTLTTIVRRLALRDIHGRPTPRPSPTVAAHALWLHQRLDPLAASDHVAEIWRDLTRLHRQLCDAAGDPVMRSLGRCKVIVDDDGHPDPEGPWSCGRPLYLPEQPPKAMDEPLRWPHVRCRACRHIYTPAEIVLLARQREQDRRPRADEPAPEHTDEETRPA